MTEHYLPDFYEYHLGNTPLVCAESYCLSKNLFVKLEQHNFLGSIKDRAAYFIFRELIDSGKLHAGIKLVESSSGNLGLSLSYFAREIGVEFTCLIDPTLPQEKVNQLQDENVPLEVVSLGKSRTYRDARILMANELDELPDWIWTRQYDNPANVVSHYKTTGPEIWEQTKHKVDIVVCSIGTGGTICGIGLFLKEMNPDIDIVAVEPLGSTIFGGIPGSYLSVGSGMSYPSLLVKNYGFVVDYWTHVADTDAVIACKQFDASENINVGVTSGAALVVALDIAQKNPDKVVVAVAPDGGESYSSILNTQSLQPTKNDVILHACEESKKWKSKSLALGKII